MRIRVFLLSLVGMLCVCLPLLGVEEIPFSVGIFALQDSSDSLLHLVEEAGYAYANQYLIQSAAYDKHLTDRQQDIFELSKLKSISSAYGSKSEKDLERAREIVPEQAPSISYPRTVTYRQIPYQEGYAKLLDDFIDSRSWYASKENLEALILVKKTQLASNDRIRLYWYDLFSDETTLIFDRVMVQKDTSEMVEEIGSAMLKQTAGSEYGLLVFDTYNSSVSLELNGEPIQVTGAQKALISGEYSLRLSGDGYVSKEMKVLVLQNAITHVPVALERSEVGDIHFSSTLGMVNWFVDGAFLDARCELNIKASLLPLVVVAQKEGFASKTLQVQKPVKEIEFTLQPEWITRSALIQDEQKGFYKSLRNTMLFFGLYVASSTLSATFDEANLLWQPLLVATSGFALVSSLHTIMNLASYAALAGSGVR